MSFYSHKLISKIKYFISIYLFFVGILFLLNSNIWQNWSLSGDDLYSLTNAISGFKPFVYSITHSFAGQYRHLTYFLFSAYKPYVPEFNLIFHLHGALFAMIPTLTFFLIRKYVNALIALLLSSTTFLTPIFFYHTFTISSLANTLICIITIIFALCAQNKRWRSSLKINIGLLIVLILSFSIKESFIIPFIIFSFIQIEQIWKGNRKRIVLLFLAGLVFAFYAYLRFETYAANDASNYQFKPSPKHIFSNGLNIASWLINYPRGWQYGAPERRPLIQLLLSSITLIILIISTVLMWLKNKIFLLISLAVPFAVIALHISLNDVHVFYFDIVYIYILFSIAYGASYLQRYSNIASRTLVILFFCTQLITAFLIKPQWLEYSFVANANKSATNYRKILEENNYSSYNQICIINHNRGVFGTEDGRLANYLSGKSFTIISTDQKILPEKCNVQDSLNLENDAWSYKITD